MIDERAIQRGARRLATSADEDGLVPAFGMFLTQQCGSYHERLASAIVAEAEARGGEHAALARERLVEVGHASAFASFGAIMLSEAWDALVAPMLESREDWVRGVVGVVNALGWGRWTIEELASGGTLTVRVDDAYEASGWLAERPARESGGVCFLTTGSVAALANLLYQGDVTRRPALDAAYYEKVCRAPGRFVS